MSEMVVLAFRGFVQEKVYGIASFMSVIKGP